MDIEARIYANEQQIILIDNILKSLCIVELNDNGRIYLKRIKGQLDEKLNDLKYLKATPNDEEQKPKYQFKFGISESIKNQW